MNTSGEYFSLNMTNVPSTKLNPGVGSEAHISIWLSLIIVLVSLVLLFTCKRMITPIEALEAEPSSILTAYADHFKSVVGKETTMEEK